MVAGAPLLQSVLRLTTATKAFINLTALFAPSLSPSAQIILPTDINYTARLTQRWTDYNAPSYIGAIIPATETDIQNIVSFFVEKNSAMYLFRDSGENRSG